MKAAVTTALFLVTKHGISKSEASRRAVEKHKLDQSKIEPLRARVQYRIREVSPKKAALLLIPEQEIFICNVIKAFSTRANPLVAGDVQLLAQIVAGLPEKPSRGWMSSFRKRHKLDVVLRKGKSSHKRGVLMMAYESVFQWVNSTEKFLVRLALDASLVFNIDETRALPASRVEFVLAAKSLKEAHYEEALDETLYTLVSCIAADGTTLFALYLFRLTPSKDDLRQSVYIPQQVEQKHTRKDRSFPIYIAVTPKGYMNGVVWMETMKIFLDLVQFRQGLGRNKQAVLYLDGCASHLKESTNEVLNESNVFPIWFPPNTSHILQPLDGEAFANYKTQARKEIHSTSLAASVGAVTEKELSLLASVRAHEKAMTSDVIKASFRNRGIFPWDKAVALTNAYLSCPTDRLLPASGDLCSLFYAEKVVEELKIHFSENRSTQRKMVQEMNSPKLAANLKDWSRRPRPSPKKGSAKIVASSSSKKILQSESDDDEDAISDSDSDIPIMPPLRPSGSANSCSHCGHQRQHGSVPVACTTCHQFFLCMKCQFNTNALAEHQKDHPELEGRRTRRRAQVPILDI